MNLIQLERRKISLKSYFIATASIPLVSLALVYFMALMPLIDPEEFSKSPQLGTYAVIFQFSFIFNTAGFSCLAATMFAKVVMEAYSERNRYLTLAYPFGRKRIFLAKTAFILLFTSCGVVISLLFTNGLFSLSEFFFPLVNDTLGSHLIIQQLQLMFLAVLLVSSIGIFSVFIGWLKDSIPLTIFVALLAISIPSNILSLGNFLFIIPITLIFSIASYFILLKMISKINTLEV